MRVFRMEGRNGPNDNHDQKSTSLWRANVSSISTRLNNKTTKCYQNSVILIFFQLQFNIRIPNIHMTQFQQDQCQREDRQFNNCQLHTIYTKIMKLRDLQIRVTYKLARLWPNWQYVIHTWLPGQHVYPWLSWTISKSCSRKTTARYGKITCKRKARTDDQTWRLEVRYIIKTYHMSHMICIIKHKIYYHMLYFVRH